MRVLRLARGNRCPVNWLSHAACHSAYRGGQRCILAVRHPSSGCPQALRDNEEIVTEAQRRHFAIPLQQAAQESPTLARLADRVRASSNRLDAIRPLLPTPLRSAVQAGPIDEGQWCLLVSSNAVAAKLRQFVPALQMHLESCGLSVSGIRIKVQGRSL